MNWLILIIAGLFETSFAFCLGKAQQTSGKENLYWWLGFLVCLFLSMFLMYKAISDKRGIHKVILLKYNSMYYREINNSVEILSFFSNRQNPKKRKI